MARFRTRRGARVNAVWLTHPTIRVVIEKDGERDYIVAAVDRGRGGEQWWLFSAPKDS